MQTANNMNLLRDMDSSNVSQNNYDWHTLQTRETQYTNNIFLTNIYYLLQKISLYQTKMSHLVIYKGTWSAHGLIQRHFWTIWWLSQLLPRLCFNESSQNIAKALDDPKILPIPHYQLSLYYNIWSNKR